MLWPDRRAVIAMNVIFGLEQLSAPPTGCVLTVGNFDGVHVGHQAILRRARTLADAAGGPVVALTFDPHPLAIVAPAKAPERLMPLSERIRRLGDAGADTVVVARSERALLGMEAETFVGDVLRARFQPAHVVEGSTFGFGRGRRGTPQMLRDLLEPAGCRVHIVEPVRIDGDAGSLAVSSSTIRDLLRSGHVDRAALCLGRRYAIESLVVHGAHRGRTIGVPTANVEMPDGQVEPGEGVYAGVTVVGERTYASAISIGRAATFGPGRRQLESHLLDFDGDLYGWTVRVEFERKIREQKKFAGADELVRQIRLDIESVRPLAAGP
jgi:riboflavin kinase/FMN adenylyltransferase